ncbi:MAG: DUF1795 domain-containing protein [Phycisphaerae bacterium]|nr:DUF1795 domain-containing protein [Phycisphaerae bacterium]MDW8263077.1 PsbP-related protein [Phycisphaerales bacterium]
MSILRFFTMMLLAAATPQAFGQGGDAVEFTSEDKSLSLKHPPDWTPSAPDRPGMIANLISPGDSEEDLFAERLNVIVVEKQEEADLDELVDRVKDSFRVRLEGYKPTSDTRTTVAGVPARKIVAHTPAQGTTAVSTQWFFIAGPRVYIVSSTWLVETEEKYRPLVEAMVNSLTLKN